MVGTSSSSTSSVSSPCCGEAAATARPPSDVCSLPATYDSRLLTTYHPRLYEHQPYPNFDSSAFYPSLSTAYGMKDAADPWRGIAPSASYYYDPSLAAYGYGGLDFNGARRKNVTRDSTSTLKAWLNEHRKNPYPTKGEKIMLAIITKMTLTQVSTWFANARRRLKKENKMTWEPRNKMDADDVKDYDDDDDADDDDSEAGKRVARGDSARSVRCESEDEGERRIAACEDSIDGAGQYPSAGQIRSPYHLLPHPKPPHPEAPTSEFTPTDSSSSPNLPDIQALMRSSPLEDTKGSKDPPSSSDNAHKPKIWSLADTATSKSPEPSAAGCGGGWFSVNPYNPSGGGGGFGGYPTFAASCSAGFVQTDTPPQTPPNMKLGAGYQGGHFYQHPVAQGSKSGGYHQPLSSRSYRPESAPEDYSTGHFRSSTLQ